MESIASVYKSSSVTAAAAAIFAAMCAVAAPQNLAGGTQLLSVQSPELALSDTEARRFHGRYTNIDYGYSVEIPDGLAGSNLPAPAPNHGFAIDLRPRSVVWVDASYEVLESPHALRRLNARLGRLKAERRSWHNSTNGIAQYHESITARGFDRRTPIIYTIEADSTADRRHEAIRVFEALCKSFRTIPVRP